MDYEALGFRAGIEIHQQIDSHKLFCSCPSQLDENFSYTFRRHLRPVQSELGDVDRAAIEEAKKKRVFIYHVPSSSSCLVEADEEPPHEANEEAIDVCLTVASMLHSTPVDEIHFMRKIVIDGSNTTGFQRTALIAMGGEIDGVGIETICLEEDASRKIKQDGNAVHYSIDRLGIPLIEISTSPDIKNPRQAMEIAFKIGMLLRATGKVKRGIGTIRQDLNVSIKDGARVEIKGVQELNDIPEILENEVKRQLEMIEVSNILKRRKARREKIEIKNVEHVFEKTSSRFLQKNKPILAVRLPKMNGVIGGVRYKEHRLGKELATHAKIFGGGIMHSDELPNYGISEQEVEKLRNLLKCSDEDGFIISAGKNAMQAIEAAYERAMQAIEGCRGEVRRALKDGFTEYMRPLPGAARMYPETDVPPIRIKKERLRRIEKNLPEMPEEKMERLRKQYGISMEEARQLIYTARDEIFERKALEYGNAKIVARILLNVMGELERKGYEYEKMLSKMDDVMRGYINNKFAKEAIEDIMRYLVENEEADIEGALKKMGLRKMDEEEIRKIIHEIVMSKKDFVMERKERALSPLMGIAMKELRGKADGATISKILKEEIEKIILQ